MRDKTKRELAGIVGAESSALRHIIEDGDYKTRARLEALDAAVAAIQPAAVDLTAEMAEDIVRKIHGPLTIGEPFGKWVRQEASHHDMLTITALGYGPERRSVYFTLRTNGMLDMEIRDPFGTREWFGTFVPPDTIET